jgi:CheY-like chemotaxis protein
MTRILIVDDSPETRGLFRRVLERAGFEVEDATTGSEALALHGARPADVVLVDIYLPDRRDGEATIAEFRRSQPSPHVIAITGFFSPSVDLERAAEDLGVPVLTKPIRPAQLVKAIKDALEG